MKIVFSSSRHYSPSYQFYAANLGKINGLEEGVSIEIFDDPISIDYSRYDVALFMGFDQQALLAKKMNPEIIVGMVEPRATQGNTFEGVDFIVVNCIEAKDYFSRFNHNILLYYAFPVVLPRNDISRDTDRLVLGYHGNKIHLEETYPRITDAINQLSEEIPVELWAMYNLRGLGKWDIDSRTSLNFTVKHIQFSEENYARYMANVDIGIVPQLIPVRESRLLKFLIGSFDHRYQENPTNYILRFKDTTNIGRHLIFAQYGIPVVSDMTPSACSFIDDEVDGYIAYHTEGWYRALKILAQDEKLRDLMGEKLLQKFDHSASINVLNTNLITFIRKFL